MVKQIVKVNRQEMAIQAPDNIIAEAIKQGNNIDLDKVEKLLEIKMKYEANEAKKAYHQAMAEFKANPPEIKKDKKVSFSAGGGKVGYSHASLYNVVKTISKELSKHGLSASWKTQQNGQILVTCKITHILGHSEETTLSAPSDTSGSKNAIQAIGSTITYLERYSLLALTGLATEDMDDDAAKAVPVEYVTDDDLMKLRDQLLAKELSEKEFCKVMKVKTLEELPKSQLKKAQLMIEGAKRKW